MADQKTDRSRWLVPILLVILGVIVNAIAYAMGAADAGSLESTQVAVETMARLSVLMVLGGLAVGLSAYCCGGGD
jgi:hypothetical protein